MLALLAGLVAVPGALTSPAAAATVYNADCATLQTMLNAAAADPNGGAGDTVALDDGGSPCSGSYTLPGGSAFTLESAAGTSSGFDGSALSDQPELSGTSIGSMTITGLSFEGEDTSSQAVELTQAATGDLTISDDSFENDTAVGTLGSSYAPVEIDGGGSTSCTSQGGSLTIEGSSFESDQSTNPTSATPGDDANVYGGALALNLYCGHDPVTLTGNTFDDDTLYANEFGDGYGGGLFIGGPIGSSLLPTVTQSANVFEHSAVLATAGVPDGAPQAEDGGGGEYVQWAILKSAGDIFYDDTIPGTADGAGDDWSWGAGLSLFDQDTTGCGATQETLDDDVVVANEILQTSAADPANSQGAGIYAGSCDDGSNAVALNDSTVTENGVTGPGSGAGSGAVAGIWGESYDQLVLDNTIVYGDYGGDELSSAEGGFDPGDGGSLTASHSDVCAGAAPLAGSGNICADPLLADHASTTAEDVHETAASPTIGAGSDSLVPAGLTSDFYGAAREPAASACQLDIGAAEYAGACGVPDAPPQPAATAGIDSATVAFAAPADNGSPITSYTVTAEPGGEQLSGAGSPITITGLSPTQAYTFTVSATNALGSGPASAPSAPVTPLAPQGGATPPKLSHLRVSLLSFFAARSGGSTTKRPGVGTTISYRDSEAATSTLSFYRVSIGIRRHGACKSLRRASRRRSPRHRRRGRRLRAKLCHRFALAGSLTHADRAGANKIHFSGRVGGRALRSGLYQLRIAAALDGAKSNTVKVEFDVF
jgi:Fibronectin type III domain